MVNFAVSPENCVGIWPDITDVRVNAVRRVKMIFLILLSECLYNFAELLTDKGCPSDQAAINIRIGEELGSV